MQEHMIRSTSAVYENRKTFINHQIKLEDVKVLATEDHKDKRRVKEAMLIKLNPTLNRNGSLDRPPIYDAVQWSRDGWIIT